MIKQEPMTIDGRSLVRTWSDRGVYICRDGRDYCDAVDPAESGRVYTETDRPIEKSRETQLAEALEALEILGVRP